MKTVFCGTPALAVPYLELLAAQTELKAVVTTPDEPAGRGYALKPSPVKEAALQHGLPVLQPDSVRTPTFAAELSGLAPDFVLVVAYGKILPLEVLRIPQLGFMNVHFSLLPAYRGAAPIQRAIMNGERKTGVSLFWLDPGMDTGPLFLQKECLISPEDDAEGLRSKLVALGLAGLREVLESLETGKNVSTPQTGVPTLAPPLRKEEGDIVWDRTADQIHDLVRGTIPWPSASTYITVAGKKQRLKILKTKAITQVENVDPGFQPGTLVSLERGSGFVVKSGHNFLLITQVQPEGKRPMSAWDFWQGARLKLGEKLG